MQFLAIAAVVFLALQTPPPAPLPEAKKPAQADKPKIYDEAADAKASIAAAVARAKANHRRVLIQWGSNGCSWCVKLHDLCAKDPAIAKTLKYEYDVVLVDYTNTDLMAAYGVDTTKGLPYLSVLDGQGKLVANQETGVLEDPAKGLHDPAKVLEFLKAQQAPYPKATDLLAQAQAQALAEKKRVLLTFGAPWCGWCHKLEAWYATPLAKGLLAKDFVIRKIDVDRTVGGKDLYASYRPEQDGIPWFCVIDEAGKALGSSIDARNENIGFPSTDEEIMAFATMLAKVARSLTLEDIDKLQRSLVEVRESDLRKQAR